MRTRDTRRHTRLCARQELTLAVRSRLAADLRAGLRRARAARRSSGYVLSGGSGVQDFARTAASLVQLVLLLVPLTSLVFGVTGAHAGTRRRRTALLAAVPRAARPDRQAAGSAPGAGAAQALGFGAAGVICVRAGRQDSGRRFSGVVGRGGPADGGVPGIAASIAGGDGDGAARARSRIALVVWFAAVVLFDVAALGLASWCRSGPRLASADRRGDRQSRGRVGTATPAGHRGHAGVRRRARSHFSGSRDGAAGASRLARRRLRSSAWAAVPLAARLPGDSAARDHLSGPTRSRPSRAPRDRSMTNPSFSVRSTSSLPHRLMMRMHVSIVVPVRSASSWRDSAIGMNTPPLGVPCRSASLRNRRAKRDSTRPPVRSARRRVSSTSRCERPDSSRARATGCLRGARRTSDGR